MKFIKNIFTYLFILIFANLSAQYFPKNAPKNLEQKAEKHADSLYQQLSLDEKIGQLYIVALYNNRGEEEIQKIRNLVEKEKIGGLILMQDNAEKHIQLLNEFQGKSRVKMMIGIDGEWGLFQRFPTAHKFPWAMTLGAIQNNSLIYEMTSKIAEDCKRMGIYWDFAPVVDVNTNPANPIIGNRSFGSDINNVIAKGLAYAQGLQDNGVLASMKHFPGHGDTDTDSHLDLPVVSHNLERLNAIELAPFKALLDKKIGGVMVAHLYVPAIEKQSGIPASVSYDIITNLLKKSYQYNGLIITDALNMNAVAKKFPAGELDLKAFKAGNDIMLFSQDVPNGKSLIKSALEKGEITENRLAESVKKILKTKYLLGLQNLKSLNPENINEDLNNASHAELSEKLYANAITLLKDEKNLLPLNCSETYYYLPLEEAPFQTFVENLNLGTTVKVISKTEIAQIPENSTVIVGFHKDNSTAYKSYKISQESKDILAELSKKQNVILDVFGSPYALKDVDISKISTVLVSYENNDLSLKAAAKALLGKTKISGKLPVIVNENLKAGSGIEK
ncbi:glycoside hydrolase family 3 protein [Cloacibacterium sp. TD35]|uniref:glycoside hydrolase family 3 protein n=1 Tax=Cloacibacterium sp. TD35 TaxID=2976818 RepID=UPI00237DBAC8|nr:glycoside hydrolase family 3 N-terminal domain-containing protein [Cloacibacterium sp. TD35]WDT68298.1 glycoside hydrolase family 3 protein [Cloacibacterium sp. TD35]